MNRFQSCLACAAALSAAVAFADVTPFENLKTTQAVTFSVAAGGDTSNCTLETDSTTVTTAGGYYVIESDLAAAKAPLVVAQSSAQIKEIESFDIVFKAAFVDADSISTATVTDAKFGFALTDKNAAKVYDGSKWNDVTLTADVTEDSEYTLHVDYDDRTKQARFILNTSPAVTSAWMTIGQVANNSISILGTGQVKSLAGATFTIDAEVIVVTPPGGSTAQNIEFTETQMDDLRAQLGGDASAVSEKLSSTTAQANGLVPMDNYVLFGKVADSGEKAVTADLKPVVKGVPTEASAAGKVKVQLTGLNVQTVAGTTVQYKLMGSADGSTGWTQIGEPQNNANFEFDQTTSYRYFKVVTVITYGTAK